MIDMHSHTYFSPDSLAEPIKNIEVALGKDIKVLAFTDHVEHFAEENIHEHVFNVDDYFKTLSEFQEKFKGQIDLLIGVEIGLGEQISQWTDEFTKEHPFDFIIGSIHTVFEENSTWNFQDLNQNPSKWYKKYYETMLTCVQKTKSFHVLGHIDYIDRYIQNKEDIIPYHEYADILDEVLKEIIRSNRGIEYNTAGFRNNLSYGNPKDSILKRYLELGGEILTISSDAHTSQHIGYGIREAQEHLKSLGFKKLSIFKKKKLEFLPLE